MCQGAKPASFFTLFDNAATASGLVTSTSMEVASRLLTAVHWRLSRTRMPSMSAMSIRWRCERRRATAIPFRLHQSPRNGQSGLSLVPVLRITLPRKPASLTRRLIVQH